MTITVLPSPGINRRTTHAVCDSLGRLWVHGESMTSNGVSQNTAEKRAERYDPTSGTWSFLAASPNFMYGYGRARDAADRIITASGQSVVGQAFLYDPSTDSWAAIATFPINGSNQWWRDSSSRLWIYVANGRTAFYSGGTGGTWTEQAVGPSFGSTAFWIGGDGGDGGDGALQSAAGEMFITPLSYKYNPTTDTWTTLSVPPPGHYPDGNSTACILPTAGQLYTLFSGSSDFCRYDIATNTWVARAAFPGPAAIRRGHLLTDGTNVFYLGGDTLLGGYQTACYQYAVATDVWTTLADTLSLGRLPVAVKDTQGAGWYLVEGPGAGFVGTNVVEYFLPPGAAAPPSRGRRFAAIFG